MHVLNIAHRGGAGLWPENSLAAFRKAVALGADGAELDVQLSRDGEVVVFHDFRLKPEICRDGRGAFLHPPTPLIKDLTFAQLREFEIGHADPVSDYASRHPDLLPVEGERIPLLSEVIAVAKQSLRPFTLFVELKSAPGDPSLSVPAEVLADAALAVIGDHGYLADTVFVGFDWPGLVQVKRRAPEAECWFTSDLGAVPDVDAALHTIRDAGGAGWFPCFPDATPEAIAAAHRMGLKLGAWTVNRPNDMRALIGAGIDALCTDRPDILQGLS